MSCGNGYFGLITQPHSINPAASIIVLFPDKRLKKSRTCRCILNLLQKTLQVLHQPVVVSCGLYHWACWKSFKKPVPVKFNNHPKNRYLNAWLKKVFSCRTFGDHTFSVVFEHDEVEMTSKWKNIDYNTCLVIRLSILCLKVNWTIIHERPSCSIVDLITFRVMEESWTYI